MKKLILGYFAAIIISLGVNSCGKNSSNGDNIVIYKVPVEIAARYIAMAFCNASAGINYHLEKAAAYTAQGFGNFDSTLTIKKLDSTVAVKFQYHVVYNFARLATLPPKVSFDYTADGGFSCDAIDSQDEQLGNWNISTLDQPQVTISGTGRDGGGQYAHLEKVYFNSRINYTLQNVMMDKQTYMAATGSVQIDINGNVPAGTPFNYSGTLTFNGDRLAELILGGITYNINLSSGAISK